MSDFPDRDEESGKFTPAVDDPEDILGMLEPGEQYRTSEIAEMLDMTRQGAHNYLVDLHEAGEIERTKVHSNLVLYELPDDPVRSQVEKVREQAEQIDGGE